MHDEETAINRLKVTDKKSDKKFLVHTGSQVSVLPKEYADNSQPTNFTLRAVNETPIKTYGTKKMKTEFKLGRDITWNFFVADIPQAIIGADFLAHHKLLVKIHGQALKDKKSHHISKGSIVNSCSYEIFAVSNVIDSEYDKIFKKFPEIIGLAQTQGIAKTKVTTALLQKGLPVAEHPRPLSPEIRAATKKELDLLLSGNGTDDRLAHGQVRKKIKCRPENGGGLSVPKILRQFQINIQYLMP